MAQEYSRSLLRVAIAQICQNLGWNSIHSTPLELLTDVLERYLFQLGKVTHRYAEQFGRTDPRLEDVFLSFGHLGVQLNELEDYLKHVDLLPFARDVVAFPVPKRSNLQIPNPASAEVQSREEHIPEYLPLMFPSAEEEIEEPSARPPGSPLEPIQETSVANGTETSLQVGDKRVLTSPETPVPYKRQRLTTSSLPEEALHSQYEMKSVIMTNNGILSPVKQGKLPDSNTPPQIALVKPKTIVTLDFSKDSNEPKKIIEVKSIKTETDSASTQGDNEKDDSSSKKEKSSNLARVLKAMKETKPHRGPGRPKSPGRSKVPKVIHSKGGVDLSSVTSMTKGADILSKEKIIVLPSPMQDKPLDMSKKSPHSDSAPKSSAAAPFPMSLEDLSILKPDLSLEQRLILLEYAQRLFMEKQKEVQQEKDIDDTIASVIQKSVREIDDRKSEYEKLRAELAGEADHVEKLFRAPHLQLRDMDSWRVSHISETYSPYDQEDRDKQGRDDPYEMDDGSPTFVPSPWRRGRPPKKPRGRPRGSGLSRGSPLGRGSSPFSRGIPPYTRGLSPRGRPRGSGHRSPGRPRLSGGSPGRPRGSSGSPRGSGLSPGRPRLSGHSPGPGRPRGSSPRGRPRGRSPRSRSPRGGSPRGSSPRGGSPRGGSPRAILNINFDDKPHTPEGPNSPEGPDSPDEPNSPDDSDSDINENQKSLDAPASPLNTAKSKSPSPEKIDDIDIAENVTVKTETPVSEHAPSPKVITETISETPVPKEVVTMPIKQEIDEKPSEKRSLSRENSQQDVTKAFVSLKKVDEEKREMYIEARRRSSEEYRSADDVKEKREDKDAVGEKKDKHVEEKKERHKEHSHSRDRDRDRDRDRSKEHKKKKKKKDKEKDRERKEKHKSKEDRDEPAVQPLQKLTIKIGGSSTITTGSFSIKQEPVHSPVRVDSPKPRPEIPKLVFKVLPPKPGSTPEHDKHGEGEGYTDPTKQSWSSTRVQSEPEKPATPKPTVKSEPKPPSGAEPIFTPIDEAVKHKPSPTRHTTYMPLSPKFKPIPPAEPSKSGDDSAKSDPGKASLGDTKDDFKYESEDQIEDPGAEDTDPGGTAVEKEVTVSVVGGRVVGGKSGGRGKKRRSSVRKMKPSKGKAATASSNITETDAGMKDEDDGPPVLQREPEKEASPSPPTLFPVNNVPSPITIPALKAAPPPPSPPLTKKSPPKLKQLKETRPHSPLVREVPPTKPRPPPVAIPKPAKVSRSPRRSSPRKSPKQISPPIKRKPKTFPTSPTKKISPVKISPTEEREFQPPRTPSPSRATPSPSPVSPMYSPPLSPEHHSPLHFMIPPTPAFPTRTTSPAPSPPKPDLSPDEEDSCSTMPGGLLSMPPPSIPPMPPSSSAKKAMQRTVVAETVGTFVSASGEKIWICPACTMQDDGSPMIGCDICDDWYHWPCVDIVEEPEDESWYCPKCRPSKKQSKKPSKRGRKKKK